MPQRQISQYLFDRIKASGVDCTFGIPGDYVLPLYAAQQNSGLKTVVMTHEPAIGFAADAYARIKGLGVALVTYGAGGLNMINPTALAYAEESPLLILSGAPETKYRSQKAQLHHCVKTFATQNNVYAEVTAVNAILDNASQAKQTIDHVLDTVLSISRPGYLELPRDLINTEIEVDDEEKSTSKTDNFISAKERQYLLDTIRQRISQAKRPVILAGVQLSRFHLLEPVLKISEAFNIPVVTSILGKSAFPESHPNFIGNYFGQFGNPALSEFIDDCDCIIGLGVVLTEMETGGYTAKLPPEKLILINNEEITVGKESFQGNLSAVNLNHFIQELSTGITNKFVMPQIILEETNNSTSNLSVGHIIAAINHVMDENTCIVCDVGDCMYAGLSIKTNCFVAPGYYSSMGFGVPASIGVQMADRKKRPIVLVGDGGFQMTGMELATAVKEGLNPIVIVFNNASYAMMKFIDQERKYYDLPNWDYAALAQAVGAKGFQAETCLQFDIALQKALKSDVATLIDAVLSPNDISPTLKRLTDHFGKRMRAAATR